jgi:hypothetical protein
MTDTPRELLTFVASVLTRAQAPVLLQRLVRWLGRGLEQYQDWFGRIAERPAGLRPAREHHADDQDGRP